VHVTGATVGSLQDEPAGHRSQRSRVGDELRVPVCARTSRYRYTEVSITATHFRDRLDEVGKVVKPTQENEIHSKQALYVMSINVPGGQGVHDVIPPTL